MHHIESSLASSNCKSVKPTGVLVESRDGGEMSHEGSPRWEVPFQREITVEISSWKFKSQNEQTMLKYESRKCQEKHTKQ